MEDSSTAVLVLRATRLTRTPGAIFSSGWSEDWGESDAWIMFRLFYNEVELCVYSVQLGGCVIIFSAGILATSSIQTERRKQED